MNYCASPSVKFVEDHFLVSLTKGENKDIATILLNGAAAAVLTPPMRRHSGVDSNPERKEVPKRVQSN